MRASTEPYCLSMLAQRASRGGTMRPENSSKLWLKTFCEWSRASTLLSRAIPVRPAWIADCEMPFAAASFLKSSSQASNVPLPHGAASEGGAEVRCSATSAKTQREMREVIASFAPRSTCPSTLVSKPHQMFGATAAKTRLSFCLPASTPLTPNSQAWHSVPRRLNDECNTAGRGSTGGIVALVSEQSMRRACAATETDWPGNPRRVVAHAGRGAEAAAD